MDANQATKEEHDLAVAIAEFVIKRTEGQRGFVFAEALALQLAFYCAQLKTHKSSREARLDMVQLASDMAARALDYDAVGVITRALPN